MRLAFQCLCWRPRELGLFGLEKAPGRPYSGLPVPKLVYKKLERYFLSENVVIRQGVMALKWKRVDVE